MHLAEITSVLSDSKFFHRTHDGHMGHFYPVFVVKGKSKAPCCPAMASVLRGGRIDQEYKLLLHKGGHLAFTWPLLLMSMTLLGRSVMTT